MGERDVQEIASRSEFHARACSFLLLAQKGIDRQKVLWQLRAEAQALRSKLADIEARIQVEEEENRLDRQLGEVALNYLEQAGDRSEARGG